MKRSMLINGQRPEELRVAIVADGRLENYLVDVADSGLRRGNIFRGVVAGVQTSLNAAFVEFGASRHGFLAAHDVLPEAYHRQPPRGEKRPRIDQILERGKDVVVQVTKDAMGQKGAALTTNVSLAGRYLVFTPLDSMRGLSRKVEDEATRRAIKEKAKGLTLPDGAGYIIRTNAADQTKTALNRDLGALLRLWKRISAEATTGRGPKLLYSDQDLIIQVLRDYLDPNIQEVWIDDERLMEKADLFVRTFMPRSKVLLKRYGDRLPLFSRFQLEPQIDAIFQRQVPLPCGGSIVIDPTEALTAIDVNSGKARSGTSQEDNIFKVNLEAAQEVARQLRLRDIGGLIVVDLIDMRSSKNQKAVEKAMREALKLDKARTTVTRISENGLMEINRQRLQQAIQLRTHRTCPTCGGLGLIASPEHVALGVIRRVEARAVEGTIQGVQVSLHPELADHIQNQHRRDLAELEEELDLKIEVVAASGMHRHEENIEWFRRERPLKRDDVAPASTASARASGASRGVTEGSSAPASASAADLGADLGAELGDTSGTRSYDEIDEIDDIDYFDDFDGGHDGHGGLPAVEDRTPVSSPLEPDAVGTSATTPRKRRRRRKKPTSSPDSLENGALTKGASTNGTFGDRASQAHVSSSPVPPPPAEPSASSSSPFEIDVPGTASQLDDAAQASKKRRRRRRKPKAIGDGPAGDPGVSTNEATLNGRGAPSSADRSSPPDQQSDQPQGKESPADGGDGAGPESAESKSKRRRRRRR